ncbi:MFS transporter [Pseudonocardia phyllosphaerae]|uniref:MFS transporter n=1 Tax=Pseudonocardia phyllosphaerae TaxID=3390502 RepID=UPI00397E8B5C
MTTAAAAPPSRAEGELTHRQILTVLGGLMLGMFLAALDQTVVSTAIRTIADDLHGLSMQAWATTAFLITSTITTPLYGKLSDIFGRKPLFMTAISIFLLGSIACTLAWSMYSLAAFRALQGLGAGGLMSLALTILGDIVPPRERARYQGFFLAVFGTSSVIGPVIGGLLSGAPTIAGFEGWRWIFLVNVPIGAVALIVVYKVLNIPHVPRKARIDWPGAIALTICLVPLLLVAEQGREWGWTSVNSIVAYVVGAVGLLLFLAAERAYGDDALLPLRLFRTGVFSLSSVINLFIGMALFGGIALLPQFLQIVHGATPIESGLMMLPLMAGIMIASVVSGQLTSRTGRYKIFPVIGTAFITISMVLLWLTVTPEIPIWQLDLEMGLLGLGLGLCMQTLVLAVQNAVPARDMGVSTSTVTFFRQMGGTLGTAIFLSVVFSTVGDRIGTALRNAMGTDSFRSALTDPAVLANPANRDVVQGLRSGELGSSVLTDSSFLQQIDPRLAAPFQTGFTQSMTLAFFIAACVVAAAFVLVLFVKELPLRTVSGAQAAAAEAAVAAEAGAGDTAQGSTDRGAVPAGGTTTDVPTEAIAAVTPAAGAAVGATAAGAAAGLTSRPGADHDGRGEPTPPTTPLQTVGRTDGTNRNGGNGHGAVRDQGAGQGFGSGPGSGLGSGSGSGSGRGSEPAFAAAGGFAAHPGDGPAVDGRVQRGDGAPLAGATVTVTRLTGEQVGRTTADAEGHYRVALREPGRFLVVAAAGSLPPQAATVTVGSAPVRHDVRLTGGSGVRGTVRDSDGHGVGGVTVALIDGTGDVAASARSGEGGLYALAGVSAGTYILTGAGEGLDPVAIGVQVPPAGTVDQDLRLPQRSRLTGRVTAMPDGNPVPQALATLIDSDGAVVGSRLSEVDGTFTFDGLAAGTYTLATSGYAPVATVVALEPGRVTHSDVEFPHPLEGTEQPRGTGAVPAGRGTGPDGRHERPSPGPR